MITSENDAAMEITLRNDSLVAANATAERWRKRYEENEAKIERVKDLAEHYYRRGLHREKQAILDALADLQAQTKKHH